MRACICACLSHTYRGPAATACMCMYVHILCMFRTALINLVYSPRSYLRGPVSSVLTRSHILCHSVGPMLVWSIGREQRCGEKHKARQRYRHQHEHRCAYTQTFREREREREREGGGGAMDLMHHWQPCFRTVSAILIVLSTVVAKDAISSFHVQSDPSTDSLSSISLLGWLKTCPEDLAKHAGAFLLMAAR